MHILFKGSSRNVTSIGSERVEIRPATIKSDVLSLSIVEIDLLSLPIVGASSRYIVVVVKRAISPVVCIHVLTSASITTASAAASAATTAAATTAAADVAAAATISLIPVMCIHVLTSASILVRTVLCFYLLIRTSIIPRSIFVSDADAIAPGDNTHDTSASIAAAVAAAATAAAAAAAAAVAFSYITYVNGCDGTFQRTHINDATNAATDAAAVNAAA
jgi:hypothetical protein